MAGNIGPNTEFTDASLLDDILMQILLSDPLTQQNGISAIADCKGLSSSILKWLIPRNCKVGAAKLESLPVKEWVIHVVNMGPILKACIMLIKPFLRKATIARVSKKNYSSTTNFSLTLQYFDIFYLSSNSTTTDTMIWSIAWAEIACQMNMAETMDRSTMINRWNLFYRVKNWSLEIENSDTKNDFADICIHLLVSFSW